MNVARIQAEARAIKGVLLVDDTLFQNMVVRQVMGAGLWCGAHFSLHQTLSPFAPAFLFAR